MDSALAFPGNREMLSVLRIRVPRVGLPGARPPGASLVQPHFHTVEQHSSPNSNSSSAVLDVSSSANSTRCGYCPGGSER